MTEIDNTENLGVAGSGKRGRTIEKAVNEVTEAWERRETVTRREREQKKGTKSTGRG